MADEDMDEELLYVTGRGSKAAGAKKRARKEEDSDDDGAPAEAGASKRGKATAFSDDEDGIDPAERAKLEKMNELEREMYLFEKEEKEQRRRDKELVLNQAKAKDAEQVRASRTRPRAPTGTDAALGKLTAQRAQREAREKRNQQEERKQARGRGRRRDEDEDEDDEEASMGGEEEEEDEDEDEVDEEASEGAAQDLQGLEAEEEEDLGAGQLGARTEVYDEGTGYEEADEAAKLEDLLSIQLKRSDMEAWFNEPFFEEDVRGCVVRVRWIPPPGTSAAAAKAQEYMVVRIADIVQRNSYIFPKAPLRTRKWLHLDDLSGTGVFRQQFTLVSNSDITQAEFDKAKARAMRGGKFLTKGDVQQAQERLQHARTFKYDPKLVKEMLARKRASGKLVGNFAQNKARLTHELLAAQSDNRPEEEIQKLKDDLEHLERQERMKQEEQEQLLAAAMDTDQQATVAGKLRGGLGLALVNMRNRNKNDFKAINAAPGSAMAKAAAGTGNSGNTADVFGRRHTQSKVYWNTSRGTTAAAAAGAQEAQAQQLQRSSSGAADVTLLSSSLKRMDPAELIKVLDLSVDLSKLPPLDPASLLPKRLLGLRWYETVQQRQQPMRDWSLMSLDEYKRHAENAIAPQ